MMVGGAAHVPRGPAPWESAGSGAPRLDAAPHAAYMQPHVVMTPKQHGRLRPPRAANPPLPAYL